MAITTLSPVADLFRLFCLCFEEFHVFSDEIDVERHVDVIDSVLRGERRRR